MRIMLYGLGRGLESVKKKLKTEHKIIGYADSFAKIKKYGGGVNFYELNKIKEIEFDYLIVTIQNCKEAWKVRNMLVNNYGINSEKVIPFYVYANRELWDIKMRTYDLEEIRGLIFGNSNAAYAFLEKELSTPFVNFSVPSQDLYYEYQVFCKCIRKYSKLLKNLEYIIIDLYDYIEFNADCSLSSNILNYMYYGGIYSEHNFSKNNNFKNSLNQEMFMRYGIFLKKDFRNVWKELFAEEGSVLTLEVENRWTHIEINEPLSTELLNGSIVKNRYDSTINENKIILDNFIREIRKWNPHMKIILTLIPRYITMERITEQILLSWKIEFLNIVKGFCDQYNLYFFNYKYKKEISENHIFYADIQHMNTIGGKALSAILDEDLKKIDISS